MSSKKLTGKTMMPLAGKPLIYVMVERLKNSRLFNQTANIEASLFKGYNKRPFLLKTEGNISKGTWDNFFIV